MDNADTNQEMKNRVHRSEKRDNTWFLSCFEYRWKRFHELIFLGVTGQGIELIIEAWTFQL